MGRSCCRPSGTESRPLGRPVAATPAWRCDLERAVAGRLPLDTASPLGILWQYEQRSTVLAAEAGVALEDLKKESVCLHVVPSVQIVDRATCICLHASEMLEGTQW